MTGQAPGSVTLVVETQTHGEGSDLERFFSVLDRAMVMASRHGNAGVVVLDDGTDPQIASGIPSGVDRLDVRGLTYDEMKLFAARRASTDYVAFLDGDCLPDTEDWLSRHLDRLERDRVAASGGFTVYDGGLMARVLTIMDFGFLLPPGRRPLGCYAFNNIVFRRDLMLETPVPSGPMRCCCYAHAQALLRRGSPVQMTPEARVRHQLPPLRWERCRQGYDVVAACWTDPTLPEARWLRLGPAAALPLYARALRLDWQRLRAGRRALGLSRAQALVAGALLPVLRLIDLAGIVWALTMGPRPSRRGRSRS